MKLKWNKIKDVQRTSGAGRQDWALLDEMDVVFGTRHATEPTITIDNSMEHQDDTPNKPNEPAADWDVASIYCSSTLRNILLPQ